MSQASASSLRLPRIDRNTLPASLRAKEPIASFLFEDARSLRLSQHSVKTPFAARITLIQQVEIQTKMPRVQTEIQIFGAPEGALSCEDGWEDVPEGFFLRFLDWLNCVFKIPIACREASTCRGAAIQQGGLLSRKKAQKLCEESHRPITGVHCFEAGIWMTLAPLKQISAHAAMELHMHPEIEYLDPTRLAP